MAKLSAQLEAELHSAVPDHTVRVVLILDSAAGARAPAPASRQSSSQRRRAIESSLEGVGATLESVDAILQRFGGRRGEKPTLLRTLEVETTPAGVRALAECDGVGSVLADQKLVHVR